MTGAGVVTELARRDIHLSLVGEGKIAFDGPPGMMPSDVELIRQHKAEIIAFLMRQAGPQAPLEPGAEPQPSPCHADVLVLDVDGYAERAIRLEHDGGLAREDAEKVAACELGYADAFAFADAVVVEWRREMGGVQVPINDAAHRKTLKQVAMEFLAAPVASDAVRSGWSARTLFGVVPADAGQCFAAGAVFRQLQEGPLFAFDSEVVLYRHADGGWHHRYMSEFDTTGTVLLWEATEPTRSD
jgi:hypothetical protein